MPPRVLASGPKPCGGNKSTVMQNMFAMHARKSKTSSRFPNFDASNALQMGNNSRQGFFLGRNWSLTFAAWIDLT